MKDDFDLEIDFDAILDECAVDEWNYDIERALKYDELKSLKNFTKEDFSKKDKDGNSYLFYAQSKKAVDFLVQQGLDVNAPNNNGETPIFHAIFNTEGSEYDVLKALIDYGAKNVKNNNGMTAKDYALSRGKNGSAFMIEKLFEEQENKKKIISHAREKLKKSQNKISGTVIADEIAQKVISGEEKRTITPQVGKELSGKIIKQRKLKTR